MIPTVAWMMLLIALSPSGHYVRYEGQTLFLVGDSGTQCVLQNPNIDYREWIDDCREFGIRAIHLWSFLAPRQKRDGSVIERRYGYVYPGITPWARRKEGPPANDGLPQWDLTRFDEGYWSRLKDLCRYAKSHDIIVGITVFFGWPKWNTPKRPDWSYHPFNIINGGFLRDEKTITTACQTIYSPGVEVLNEQWSDRWPPSKKTQWVWERFAQRLIDELNHLGNVFFVFMDEHSYPEGNCGDHFLKFFKRRGAIWADWDKRRADVDFVCSPTFSGRDKNADAVKNFHKTPIRPYIHLEGGPYKGEGVRTALWTFAIGGGHYFYHDDSGQETVTTGIMCYDPNVKGCEREKHAERLRWLGYASRFFNEEIKDLEGMEPHNELVGSGNAYCLANPGKEYAVYSISGTSFTLDLSHINGRTFVGRFYDPRTGRYLEEFTCSGGKSVSFEKPDARDWALLLQQRR